MHTNNNDKQAQGYGMMPDADNEATHPIQEEYQQAMESPTNGALQRQGLQAAPRSDERLGYLHYTLTISAHNDAIMSKTLYLSPRSK